MENLSKSPLEYIVKLDEITSKFQQHKILPNKDVIKEITSYIEVDKINSLSAEINVKKEKSSHLVEVNGVVKAQIVQKCIVTNDPVITEIEENIESYYAQLDKVISINQAKKENEIKSGNRESEILDEKYDPEPIINNQIDLGDLALQFLVLGIDLYPRSVESQKLEEVANVEFETKKPFAALKNWKNLKSSMDDT